MGMMAGLRRLDEGLVPRRQHPPSGSALARVRTAALELVLSALIAVGVLTTLIGQDLSGYLLGTLAFVCGVTLVMRLRRLFRAVEACRKQPQDRPA